MSADFWFQPEAFNASGFFAQRAYSGNTSTQAIDYGFNPDFLWVKRRDATNDHNLYDSHWGLTSGYLTSNGAGSYNGNNNRILNVHDGVVSYGQNSDTNGSGNTYQSWAWKKDPSAGFDTFRYNGNSVRGRGIAHNLGKTPEFILVKGNFGENWAGYHKDLGPNFNIALNLSNERLQTLGPWNNTAPDSNNFYVGGSGVGDFGMTNSNGQSYTAYVWTSIPGFSHFGSYTGNANNNGPVVTTGFEPSWLMIKRATGGGANWIVHSNTVNPSNPRRLYLQPNGNQREASTSPDLSVDFNSDGFKIRNNGTAHNLLNVQYIYAAFA